MFCYNYSVAAIVEAFLKYVGLIHQKVNSNFATCPARLKCSWFCVLFLYSCKLIPPAEAVKRLLELRHQASGLGSASLRREVAHKYIVRKAGGFFFLKFLQFQTYPCFNILEVPYNGS